MRRIVLTLTLLSLAFAPALSWHRQGCPFVATLLNAWIMVVWSFGLVTRTARKDVQRSIALALRTRRRGG